MTDQTLLSTHQADIDDIDILVGLHGTKPERETWTRLRTALLTTPQPLAIGLDREAVARRIARITDICEQMDVRIPVAFTVKQQNQHAADLRSLLALAAPAEPLWMMHVRGPDDIYPAPDYETALAWSDYVNDVLAKAVPEVMTKAVPAIWTGTPERHANGLPEAIKGWTLPAAPTGEAGA